MQIKAIRHDWPEKGGFLISRPNGRRDCTFLHFLTPVKLRINGELIQTQPGACVFFAPGVPQWFCSETAIVHNWMHADGSLCKKLEQYAIPQNQLLYPGSAAFISRLFQLIEVEYFSQKPHKEELMESYVNEFLIQFARALEEESLDRISRQDRQKLSTVRQQILSQPERRWTVAEMADLAALSPSRFHAVYKTLFATTPMQDVIEAKTSYAKSLLLSRPNLTLPVLAEHLGYSDQYHFIRQFKAITGITPGAYRRQNR